MDGWLPYKRKALVELLYRMQLPPSQFRVRRLSLGVGQLRFQRSTLQAVPAFRDLAGFRQLQRGSYHIHEGVDLRMTGVPAFLIKGGLKLKIVNDAGGSGEVPVPNYEDPDSAATARSHPSSLQSPQSAIPCILHSAC